MTGTGSPSDYLDIGPKDVFQLIFYKMDILFFHINDRDSENADPSFIHRPYKKEGSSSFSMTHFTLNFFDLGFVDDNLFFTAHSFTMQLNTCCGNNGFESVFS